MNILYLISVIALFIAIMLIKKTNKKINFIGSFIITIVVFMCYQAIIAYFMDLAKVPITLLNVSIVNIVVTIILWIILCFKIKEFQKYTIRKADIVFIFVLLIVNIPILYKEFGFLHNFRYISTDSVMHCQAAMTFAKSDFLLDSMTNWEAVNPTFMIGSYVNDGLLMKAFVNWIGEFSLYKIYMFNDIMYYIMIGYIFYLLITSSKRCNTKLKYILAYIISIIFMIGYPLNSVITGFHYFTLGILEFITIIYVIKTLYKENKLATCIILFMLNTGIMLTYNLLAPIIYLAEFMFFIYEILDKKEKIFTKSNFAILLTVFIIPGVIGLSFFILPRIFENIVLKDQQQLWIDGYIYINYWSNIILFVPFIIYYIVKCIKRNKLNIETITLLSIVIFIAILLIGVQMRFVSVYYFMKPYFVLNMLIFCVFFKALCNIIDNGKKEKIFSIVFISAYTILLILNLLFVKVDPYGFKDNNEGINKLFDIYNSNKSIMNLIQESFTDDRMDALRYIHDNNLIENQNLLYLGNYIDNFLFKLFFTYENREGIDKNNITEHIEKWNDGEYEYLTIFYKNYFKKAYCDKAGLDLENCKTIFESENCVIYEYEK